MSDVFGNHKTTRGCFMQIQMNASGGQGAVLRLPAASPSQLPASLGDPLLVTGFSTSKVDATTHVKTFGGNVYTYAFGHDPNQSVLDVTVTAFLGQDSGVVGQLLSAYTAGRVSASSAKAKLALGSSEVVSGYLVGQSSQTQSSEYNMQVFTFRIAIVEA